MEGECRGDPQPVACLARAWWALFRGWGPVSLTLTPTPVPSLCEPLLGEGAHSPPARGLRAGPPGGTRAGRGRGGPGGEQCGDQALTAAPCQPWPRLLGRQQHPHSAWRGPAAAAPGSSQASGAAGPMLPERCEWPGENTPLPQPSPALSLLLLSLLRVLIECECLQRLPFPR